MSEEKDIEKIVLHYSDGTTKEVSKGFIAGMKVDEANQQAAMTFSMVHIGGKELKYIVSGVVELGLKLGMFNDANESEDDSE